MKSDEKGKEERPHLQKLKAFLERSHLEYTEKRKGNTTVMEIRRVEKRENDKKRD